MGEQKKQMKSVRGKQRKAEAEIQAKAESEQEKVVVQPVINEALEKITKGVNDGNEITRRILTRTEEGNQQRRDMTEVMAEGNREIGSSNRSSRILMICGIIVAALTLVATVLCIPSLQNQIQEFVPWFEQAELPEFRLLFLNKSKEKVTVRSTGEYHILADLVSFMDTVLQNGRFVIGNKDGNRPDVEYFEVLPNKNISLNGSFISSKKLVSYLRAGDHTIRFFFEVNGRIVRKDMPFNRDYLTAELIAVYLDGT